MNAYYAADVSSIHIEPQIGGLEPSGLTQAKWLGSEVYTIAMTTYEGEDGWNSAKPIALASTDAAGVHITGTVKVDGIQAWLQALGPLAGVNITENEHSIVLAASPPKR